MKNRTTLLLMEQLIMVLVFALAAALCLRCFAKAEQISTQTARRDEAVWIAQNAAEQLKAGKEPDGIAQNSGFTLHIQEADTDIPGLRLAEIQVLFDEEILFSLTTGWQEVGQ